MGAAASIFSILLIDDDELLIMDARALAHPGVTIEVARTVSDARLQRDKHAYDAIAINLALDGAWRFLAEVSPPAPGSPAVITVAARGLDGETLEYTLTRAELRGAGASVPKPIDAVELVTLALETAARQGAKNGVGELIRTFERLIQR